MTDSFEMLRAMFRCKTQKCFLNEDLYYSPSPHFELQEISANLWNMPMSSCKAATQFLQRNELHKYLPLPRMLLHILNLAFGDFEIFWNLNYLNSVYQFKQVWQVMQLAFLKVYDKLPGFSIIATLYQHSNSVRSRNFARSCMWSSS